MQLADFLAPRVESAGGMMALPDVYCLFNRARGTELISPDDLMQVSCGALGFRALGITLDPHTLKFAGLSPLQGRCRRAQRARSTLRQAAALN